ncbi:twin-arginine translocation signal domain-containing protein [Nocardioides sp.]|uniref:twin-arginine translocation signal domain-containing protein n=1 Tax=Nocardioides sp. TaxID=35761 RepID=UPI002ED6A51E
MTETSRRKFLAATGVGVAAAGTLGIAGVAQARPGERAAREQVLAYVPNHRRAEIRLLVGEREVVVQDRDLVARLLNAAGGQ